MNIFYHIRPSVSTKNLIFSEIYAILGKDRQSRNELLSPDCILKRKNPSKISLRRVRAVFTVRIFGITTKKPQ